MIAARNYRRVTKAAPCPVCGRADWCRASTDGGLVLCNRVPSPRPVRGEGGGWLHLIGHDAEMRQSGVLTSVSPQRLSTAELVLIDRQCRADLTDALLAILARTLAVSPTSLLRLCIGWHAELTAYSFAMRNAAGRIIGIRTRRADGRKQCVRVSRIGLIMPGDTLATNGESPDVLLVTEGESDAAAALDLGFTAIARPGCEACSGIVIDTMRQLRPGRVVLLADADTPGQRGANTLAPRLAATGTGCRVLTLPDAKDLRAWKARPDNDAHALAALIDAPADRIEGL